MLPASDVRGPRSILPPDGDPCEIAIGGVPRRGCPVGKNRGCMFRRTIAGFILGPSLLVGSLAWSGFLALRTVFEPDRSRTIAEELLDNDEVRSQLAANLGSAIEAALPAGAPVTGQLVDDAATTVLEDPLVEELILEAFGSTHRAFLGEGDAPETLDLTPVVASARETLAAASPALAGMLPEGATFEIDLPTEHIPDASPIRRFLERTVPYLMAISVVGALLALVSTTDRPQILRRAAQWALGTTAIYLIIGLGIPWVLRQVAPDQAEVLAALLAAVLRSTLVPSIVLASCGVGLLLASMFWPDRDRRRERAPRRDDREPEPEYAARRPAPAPRTDPGLYAPPRPDPTAAMPAPRAASQTRPPQPRPPQPTPPAPPRVVSPPPTITQPPPLPTAAAAPRPAPGDTPAATGPARSPFPTREGQAAAPRPAADPTGEHQRWLPPRWVEGHGWVLDPDDPKPPPENARWVEGVGHIVPGPPPER